MDLTQLLGLKEMLALDPLVTTDMEMIFFKQTAICFAQLCRWFLSRRKALTAPAKWQRMRNGTRAESGLTTAY